MSLLLSSLSNNLFIHISPNLGLNLEVNEDYITSAHSCEYFVHFDNFSLGISFHCVKM